MEKGKNRSEDFYVVDLAHILKVVISKAWLVVLVSILVAALAFSYAYFMVVPTYSSSVMLYINNSSISVGDLGVGISLSDLNASQKLVNTYSVLLRNKTTLDQVIKATGVPYDWKELDGMISASSVNDTEVMRITVTTTDPYEAATIANGISEVLLRRVPILVEGSSMEVVDSAVPNLQKVAPGITKYTAIGFMLGFLLSVGFLTVIAMMDNTIHDDDYVANTYDFPILAKVPDLLDAGTKKYSYYRRYSSKSYYSAKEGE